jgi:glucose-6-phosphate dehydrogenase assembly protein OpcA
MTSAKNEAKLTPEPQAVSTWSEDPTTVDSILAGLDELWLKAAAVLCAGDGAAAARPGVTRAGVINLLIYAATEKACARAQAAMNELKDVHPGRSVILHCRPEAEPPGLGAMTAAYRQAGGSACFDQVQLSARGSVCARVAGIVEQLARRELPVLLWWAAQPSLDGQPFAGLAEVADVVVVDSAELGSPLRQLQELALFDRRSDGRPALADLNWDRLLQWRELTAQFFDPQASRPALDGMASVEIVYAGNQRRRTPSAQALLLAGWLVSSLGWSPVAAQQTGASINLRLRNGRREIELRLSAAPQRAAPGSVVRLDLSAEAGGRQWRFGVAAGRRGRHGTAMTVIDGVREVARAFHFEQPSDARLLAEVIEARGVDCALDRSLAMAAEMSAFIEQAHEAGPTGV